MLRELEEIRQDNVELACENHWKPGQPKYCQCTLLNQECHTIRQIQMNIQGICVLGIEIDYLKSD